MILPIEVVKDTYVTDRNLARTDGSLSNFGRASTIDIFKLYNENSNGKYTSYFYPNDINGTNIFDNIMISIDLDGTRYATFKFVTLKIEDFTPGMNIQGEDTIGVPIGEPGQRYDIHTILDIFKQACNNIGEVNQDGPSGNIDQKITCNIESNDSIVFLKTLSTHKTASIDISSDNLNLISFEDFNCVEKSYSFLRPDFESIINKNLNSDALIKAELVLRSVNLGNTIPEVVDISCYKLLKKFDEGYGNDVNTMSDLGICNFVSLSRNSDGTTNDFRIPCELTEGEDISAELSSSTTKKSEDLTLDVTQDVFDMLVNIESGNVLDHEGYAIGLNSSLILDKYTYFVKRFASRHVSNKILRPVLMIHLNDSLKKTSTKLFDTNNIYEISSRGIEAFIDQNNVYQVFCRGYINKYNDVTMSYGKYILFDRQMIEKKNAYGNLVLDTLAVSSIDTDVSRFDTNLLEMIKEDELEVNIEFYGITGLEEINIKSESVKYKVQDTRSDIQNLYLSFSGNSNIYKFANNSEITFSLSFLDRNKKYSVARKKRDLVSEFVGSVYYNVIDVSTGKMFIKGLEDSNKLSFDGEKYIFDFYAAEMLKDREIQFEFIVDNNEARYTISNETLKMRLR